MAKRVVRLTVNGRVHEDALADSALLLDCLLARRLVGELATPGGAGG